MLAHLGPNIGHARANLTTSRRTSAATLRGQASKGIKTVELAVFQSIGPTELIIVLAIVLIIFGPKRLPGLGRQLGSGMREFKDSITGKGSDHDLDEDEDDAAKRSKASPAALEGSEAEQAPVDGEVVSDRAPK
jgi:sec-independent protein translocase protein TatA